MRIASLLPSATEIACALGFESELVGRSHECDHPPSVASLPALTEPQLDRGAPGREIDAHVRRLVADGLSVYRVDAERLRDLAPTVILTQQHCEVCAASPRDLEAALAQWLGAPPQLVSLEPNRLDHVLRDFARVAEALGAPGRGLRLARSLSGRLDAVAERTAQLPERPRVVCLEWIEPLMAAGNWMPELVVRAGGQPLFGEPGRHSPWLDWEELRAADPEVLVVLPCGFDVARTRRELAPLLARPGFGRLAAVRRGRVAVADGNRYFNRPGPRLAESLEILAELLHPAHFPARHEGSGWEWL